MKRFTRLLSLLIVAVMLVSSASLSVSAVSTALQGKTIIALGDSMTDFGTTATGSTHKDGEKTYPYYMGTNDYLGVPVINAGVGGDTTNHVMARFKTDVLDKNPDVVLICIGMNDQAMTVSNGQPLVPLATYKENLNYFVNQLKAIGSDVIFVTQSPVNTNAGYYKPGGDIYGLDYSTDLALDFFNVMREVAIDNECSLVDIYYECAFEDLDKFIEKNDGIHQSDYGRRQFAKYISEHLEAVYDGKDKATMTVKCVDANGNTIKTVTHVGKAGAHITLATPAIEGYATDDADIQTTFVNGNTFTFTYSPEIYGLIAKAKTLSAYDYSNSIIDLIRKEVENAEALANKAGVTSEELVACAGRLNTLLNINETYVVSKDASYTTTAPNRGTAHDDDKIRLTDGIKGTTDGGASRYSGWNGNSVTIDIDLGAVYEVNSFSTYSVWGDWGIEKPDSITVSVSDDGKNYTDVASQTDCKVNFISASWSTSVLTAVTENIIKTRYVRFTVASQKGFIWLDEVEVALRTTPEANRIYVNKINEKVLTGDSIVFTPAFGKITGSTANHMWTANAIAKWDAQKNAYVVKSVSHGNGDSTPDIELADDEILIATHSDQVSANCIKNKIKTAALTVGQTITLNGISVNGASLDVAPYIVIDGYKEEEPLQNGKNFVATHFNDNTVEGAGVIFTQEYLGFAWGTHASFKPVEGLDGVYEIAELSKGAGNGSGKPLAIPEGGFVWVGGFGNDYPTLYASDNTKTEYKNKPNYTNQAIKTMIDEADSWKVGDKFAISGLDLIAAKVPTETPYIDWYQPNYVGTALYAPYGTPHTHTPGEWITLADGSQELRCTDCGELVERKPAPTEVPDNAKTFWVTHINDNTAEGAGALITDSTKNETYAWAWRIIAVFKPVEGLDNVYEITAFYNHLGLGVSDANVIAAHASNKIPEGGFIYNIGYGNDYISLGTGDTDYTSPNCNNAVEDAKNWKVGDRFVIYGIDPSNPTVSTSTPNTKWYDDAYVCTSFYAPYVEPHTHTPGEWVTLEDGSQEQRCTDCGELLDSKPAPSDDPETKVYALGDIDMNGIVNQYDYILAKRAHFNTITFDENQKVLGDMNEDGKNDQYDYILVKRIHFKNYSTDKTVEIVVK